MTDLNDLSFDELKDQAELLGVKFDGRTSEELLKKRIQEKLGEPTEDLVDISLMKADETESRITIIINENERDKQPVPVGVNGKTYLIQRGKKVAVPPAVIEVLNHAEKEVWSSDMDESHKVLRYPYQVVAG